MAFPVVVDVETWTSGGAAVNDINAVIPAGVQAGDILLCYSVRSDLNNAGTIDSFWTAAGTLGFAGQGNMQAQYRICDGTESGTVLVRTIATADAAGSITYLIRGGIQERHAQNTVVTATTDVDPPSLTPNYGAADTLWFILCFTSTSGKTLTLPSGYGNATTLNSGIGSSSLVAAYRTANTATENPGIGTWSGSGDTGAFTWAIRPLIYWGPYSEIYDNPVSATGSDTLLSNAIVKASRSSSATLNAVVKASRSGSATANAIVKANISGSATLDAIVKAKITATGTLDAIVQQAIAGSASLNAIVNAQPEASRTLDAIVKANVLAEATLDAVVQRSASDSFTANAFVLVVRSSSAALDAVVKATRGNIFDVDAEILAQLSSSFTLDAITQVSRSSGVTVDAIVKATRAGSATVDAIVSRAGRAVWTTPANGVTISESPSLTFLMPIAVANMHFQLQLDTVDTFDGGDLIDYRSADDLTGWEYWNGSDWVAVPSGGVSNSFAGNEARLNVPVPLAQGFWYRRVRARVV